jgi:hypothetical protein
LFLPVIVLLLVKANGEFEALSRRRWQRILLREVRFRTDRLGRLPENPPSGSASLAATRKGERGSMPRRGSCSE